MPSPLDPRWLGGIPDFTLVLRTSSQDLRPHLHVHALSVRPWVVHAKTPLAGPAAVLDYLGRYTHRTAIGNQHMLGTHGNDVYFRMRASTASTSEAALTTAARTAASPHSTGRSSCAAWRPSTSPTARTAGAGAGAGVLAHAAPHAG